MPSSRGSNEGLLAGGRSKPSLMQVKAEALKLTNKLFWQTKSEA